MKTKYADNFVDMEIEYYLGDFEKKGDSIRVYQAPISKFIKSIFKPKDIELVLIGWEL